MAVYIPKGTTSKETVEIRSYGKNFFMVKFPKFLGSPTYKQGRTDFLKCQAFRLVWMVTAG